MFAYGISLTVPSTAPVHYRVWTRWTPDGEHMMDQSLNAPARHRGRGVEAGFDNGFRLILPHNVSSKNQKWVYKNLEKW
jgi:hypothetical protein